MVRGVGRKCGCVGLRGFGWDGLMGGVGGRDGRWSGEGGREGIVKVMRV